MKPVAAVRVEEQLLVLKPIRRKGEDGAPWHRTLGRALDVGLVATSRSTSRDRPSSPPGAAAPVPPEPGVEHPITPRALVALLTRAVMPHVKMPAKGVHASNRNAREKWWVVQLAWTRMPLRTWGRAEGKLAR